MSRVRPGRSQRAAEPGRGRSRAGAAPADRPGWAVTAPGFYVWDEDPGYARAWAAELGRVRPAAVRLHGSAQ
jgi:hypothetical protein